MNLSLGEYRSLVSKALRGVGYSWGLADDGAFAIRRLETAGIPTAQMLIELLLYVDGSKPESMAPDGAWQPGGSALCPVWVGTSLSDQSGCETVVVGPTIAPIIMAPFLALTLGNDDLSFYTLDWRQGRCTVSCDSITVDGQLFSGPVSLSVSRSHQESMGQSATPTSPQPAQRVEVSDANVAELARLAHRVYAPATTESRMSGAGAGVTDND